MPHFHFNRFALMFAVGFALQGCGDTDTQTTSSSAGTLVSSGSYTATLSSAQASVSQKITYTMPSVNGTVVNATAVVLVPKGTAPTGGWPVIAWAHGTTGVADTCAPSLTSDLAGYDAVVATLLNAGYMVVAPDYEGLGVAGLHPYLNLASEGRSLVYAVVAAKKAVPTASTQWMAMGHSQGGHAALGAAQYAAEATGMTYRGTVAFAPASNLATALSSAQQQVLQLSQAGQTQQAIGLLTQNMGFTALVTAGLRQSTSVNYSDVFETRSAPLAALAESVCLPALGQSMAQDIGAFVQQNLSIPSNYPALRSSYASVPAIASFLTMNEPAQVKLSAPVLLLQGAADTTVPKGLTDLLNQTLLSKGSSVTYQTFASADHTGVVSAGLASGVAFAQQRFAAAQ